MYTGTIINNFLIISIFVTIRFLNTYYNDNKWDLKHVFIIKWKFGFRGGGSELCDVIFQGVLLFVTKCDKGEGEVKNRPK